MPFLPTQLIVSTDLDNIKRGIFQQNATNTLTGTLVATDLLSAGIGAGAMGSTGGIHVIAAGTISGVAGNKQLLLLFGGTLLALTVHSAGTTNDWFFDAWIFNTTSTTQRVMLRKETNDALTSTFDYLTSAIDTTVLTQVVLRGQLGNAGDSISATMLDVQIVNMP